MTHPPCPFVSRGGLKLAAALDAFAVNPTGLVCADLGASTGGFTDCLLQRGAARVFAVDCAWGQLAWKLRTDPRVVPLERTNVLHFDPFTLPEFPGCDLVTIDLGWTPQALALPAALRWLKPIPSARIISLVKPQYEASHHSHQPRRTILSDEQSLQIFQQVLQSLPALNLDPLAWIPSPIRGAARSKKPGNLEYLVLIRPRLNPL